MWTAISEIAYMIIGALIGWAVTFALAFIYFFIRGNRDNP